MKHLLVATNGTPAATLAVRRAVEMAEAEGAEITFLSVARWSDSRMHRFGAAGQLTSQHLSVEHDHALEEAAEIAGAHGVPYRLDAIGGDVLDVILETERLLKPDLLIVGSDGHRGLLASHRLGLAETIARRARCPVLVVKQPKGPSRP